MASVSFGEPTARDRFISVFFVFVTLMIIVLGGFLVLESFGFILWFVIAAVSIFLLVKWHSMTRGYRCANCGHEFGITFWQDLPAANSILFKVKMLTCPKCDHRDYATELKKVKSE